MFYVANKNYQKKLMKTKRNDFLIRRNFLIMISISLFYFCKNVFTLMTI